MNHESEVPRNIVPESLCLCRLTFYGDGLIPVFLGTRSSSSSDSSRYLPGVTQQARPRFLSNSKKLNINIIRTCQDTVYGIEGLLRYQTSLCNESASDNPSFKSYNRSVSESITTICQACLVGKAHLAPYLDRKERSETPLHRV